MATQSPINQYYPQQPQPSASQTPYFTPVSSRPAAPGERVGMLPASTRPYEAVVIINDPNANANVNGGEWAVGLKECYKSPSHCFLAVFWPCGIAATVAKAIELSPLYAGAFFAIALLGDVLFTVLAWIDVYSNGDAKPKFIYNFNMYYFAGKPPQSHWSTVGYVFGLLFVIGVWRLRAHTQKFYGIKRRIVFELYATLLCTCCSMAQMSKHVEIRTRQQQEQQAAQAGRVDVLPAFS
ncbi:Uncharacterized protein FI667_g5945 [Globisporangium polare]